MATLDPGVLPRALSLRTPGKINLTLEIMGRRPDGYHDLRSVVIGVALCDDVRVVPSDRFRGITITCHGARVDASTNLARVAATALAERYDVSSGVDLSLRKRIPIGAGLGGGSSDAAAALRLCNGVWGLGLREEELAAIGAEIGSDVPLFFHLPSAVVTGRGERVERRAIGWRGWVLLIRPPMELSTREVYTSWRADDASSDRPSPGDLARCVEAKELTSMLFNDLERAAFRVRPALGELKTSLEARVGAAVRMTGSGSTLFQLFDDGERAAETARFIESRFPGVSTTVVEAPVSSGDLVAEEC